MAQLEDFDDHFDSSDAGNMTQTQLDFFSAPLTVPVGKLDADQYAAEDLDGVTESLFGSGNMNFLSLQASQTNDVIAASDPFALLSSDHFGGGMTAFNNAQGGQIYDRGADSDASTNTDRAVGDGHEQSPQIVSSDGNFAASTVGSVGASALAADSGKAVHSQTNTGTALSGANGIDGTSGSGKDGINGKDGQDGTSPPPPPGPPDDPGPGPVNNDGDINININLGDINLGDVINFIDDTVTNLGDTINTITTSLTDITNILETLIQNLNVTDILNLTEITNNINNLTQNLTSDLGDVLTQITNVTDNVTNVLETLLGININLHPVKHITGDIINKITDLGSLDILGDVLSQLNGVTNILHTKISHITNLVGNAGDVLNVPLAVIDNLQGALGNLDSIVGVVTGTLDDALGGLLDGLGVGGGGSGDGDLNLGGSLAGLGLGLPAVNLDNVLNPVEDLVGDIDIGLGLGLDLLGANGNDINNANGDTDLNLGLDLDIVGIDILGDNLHIPLDPVEAIVGDIDLDLGAATNILGNLADGLVNNAPGGTGQDNLLSQIGDGLGNAVSDIAGGALPGVGDLTNNILPNITEGVEDLAGSILPGLGGGASPNDLLGNVLLNVTDGLEELVTEIVPNLTGGLEGGIGDVVPNLTGAVEDVLGNVLPHIADGGLEEILGGGLPDLGGGLEDTVSGLAGGLLAGLGGNGGVPGDGDAHAGININTPILDLPGIQIDVDQLTNPVEDLVGDFDIGLGLGLDLLGANGQETNNASGDSDLTLAGDLDLLGTDILGGGLEIPLDPLEAITGDIDLDLGAATNILGSLADPLVNGAAGGTGGETLLGQIGGGLGGLTDAILPGLNGNDTGGNDLTLGSDISLLDQTLAQTGIGSVLDPVEDIIGDIDSAAVLGLNLLGQNGNDTDNSNGDSDLEIHLDLDIGGLELPDIDLDIPLDPLESVLGDIDLQIGTALDLLNADTSENSGGDGGLLSDVTSWTESTIQNGGGLFGDIISGIGGETDSLPEPVSSVAEGLGALLVVPPVVIGKLGGLFGH